MNRIEKGLVKWVAKIAPWLAPFPSAYFVARSAMERLELPLLVAIVVAAIIETLGLSTVHTALWALDWNSHKRKTDPAAPAGLAIVLGGVYLVATLGLVVFLEVWPLLATYAPALFPALAVVGAVNLALISQQERREAEVEAQKAERRKARRLSKKAVQQQTKPVQEPIQEKTGTVQEPVPDVHKDALMSINTSRKEKKSQLLDSMLDIYRDSPETGATEMSKLLDIGRSTVYTYQAELEEAGRLQRNDGHGYQVLEVNSG